MSYPIFYQGQPISFGCQFMTTDTTPVPINITGYTDIEVWAVLGQEDPIQFVYTLVNATLGLFSIEIADSITPNSGDYNIQITYTDNLGVQQASNLGIFSLLPSVKYG